MYLTVMLHLFTPQMILVGPTRMEASCLMLGNDSIETSREVSTIAFSASRGLQRVEVMIGVYSLIGREQHRRFYHWGRKLGGLKRLILGKKGAP